MDLNSNQEKKMKAIQSNESVSKEVFTREWNKYIENISALHTSLQVEELPKLLGHIEELKKLVIKGSKACK